MKKAYLFLLIAAVLTSCRGRNAPAPLGADAPADNVPDIIGDYALNATDPAGEQYGGTLSISAGEKSGEYKLIYLLSGGIHEGIGILEGNKLGVTWKTSEGNYQNLSGTATYTITENGELYGDRYINGVETPGKETAYPNP